MPHSSWATRIPCASPKRGAARPQRNCACRLWTVDADVIVPSKLLEKAQYASHIIRPRLHAQLPQFFVAPKNPAAHHSWKKPKRLLALDLDFDITQGWNLDRSVAPVSQWRGGSKEAQRLLRQFIRNKLSGYSAGRNQPEIDHTSRMSPYLHFGHISPLTVALAVRKRTRRRRTRTRS